jgi:sigma-E factor negative regulatory protein RseA
MDKISALMDGELARAEAARLVAGLRDGNAERSAMRETWTTYHLIGDALRGEVCPDCGVMQSVAKRLQQEPTVLAPRRLPDDFGRRWGLPSMAAAAAVASVSWMAFQTQQVDVGPAAIPASHMVVPVVAVQSSIPLPEYSQSVHLPGQSSMAAPVQFSARELDAYLRAHQEFSPSTTLQGLAPYVRTVTSGAVEAGR